MEKYSVQLNEIERRFNAYKQSMADIIHTVSSAIHHTVITKGEIANPTPYYYERMGIKVNGRIIQTPIISDDCMKYHYDNQNRIIMIEEYSVFLSKFEITEIYLYHEQTERLWLSCETLARLFVFDNAFSNTTLCLSFAYYNGYAVEEFLYDGDILNEIHIHRDKVDYQLEIHRFIYEQHTVIQIERLFQNGYKELLYTTKKPNFNKIKEDTYNSLKNLVTACEDPFVSFGIEGFLDQQQPMFCVCFTGDCQPSDLIADWNVEMHNISVYDWQFNGAQEKKCIKTIAEIIVKLTEDGLLKDKNIFFHQNQVCVTQLYAGAKTVFQKADICVR